MSDVPISEDGVSNCQDMCKAAGFTYFGFECPMGMNVHCECSNNLNANQAVDNQKCQEFNTQSGPHCSGPFSLSTNSGTYYMGAGGLNSAYAVEPTFPGK